jgi:protein arginine kinase
MASAIFQAVICEQCGEKEAMVFIRRSGGPSDGRDVMLCEFCANGRGISAGKGGLELNIDDLISAGSEGDRPSGKTAVCPRCGLEVGALRREGRLGCVVCTDVFHDEILKALGRRPKLGRQSRPAASAKMPARAAEPGAQDSSQSLVRLARRLESALESEDYEEAARLRDELSSLGSIGSAAPCQPSLPLTDFPFRPGSSPGPEDDVVLSTSARVYRNVANLPFPASPRGSSAPSRSVLLDRIQDLGPWRPRTMAGLHPAARRALSERGIVTRGYASDDTAPLLTHVSLQAFILLDEGDHLRLRTILPGFDVETALSQALDATALLARGIDFAAREDIGWICARVSDCGLGCSISATLHLPALSAAGMRDRIFRSLLAEGLAIRGFYSSTEESAGAIYEIGLESSSAPSEAAMAAHFSEAIARLVASERRARSEIAERGRAALQDAEGRAFGITRWFGLSGTEEAASLLSVLRLASLRGSLAGADHRILGSLLLSLGSGSIALASGLEELPPAADQDLHRARIVKEALASAEYRIEEGA